MSYFAENGYKGGYLLTTVFPYYSVPVEMWRGRMDIAVAAGFNCVDIYFPWNFHETEEGVWRFDGIKDIRKLLETAGSAGLYVIAHPGPHVSFVWDGGGIPPFLLPKMDESERAVNDVHYEKTGYWHDKILPMIKEFEGTVIGVECELFEGPFTEHNQVAVLNNMEKHGISVPVSVVVKSSKTIAENNPLSFKSSSADAKIQLAQGAKRLFVPNYIGAFSLDFFNTIAHNNFGGAFVSCAIGENTLISPFGEVNDEEAADTRLFKMQIEAYGDAFFKGKPIKTHNYTATGENAAAVELYAYEMYGGGHLIACVNTGSDPAKIALQEKSNVFPKKTKIIIRPHKCRYVVRNFSLKPLGVNAVLEYSSCELVFHKQVGESLFCAVLLDEQGEMRFCVPDNTIFAKGTMNFENDKDSKGLTAHFSTETDIKIEVGAEKMRFAAFPREIASIVREVDDYGVMTCYARPEKAAPIKFSSKDVVLTACGVLEDSNFKPHFRPIKTDGLKYLENNGIYRGFAVYEMDAEVPAWYDKTDLLGFVLCRSADVAGVYWNGKYITTRAGFSANEYIEVLTSKHEIYGDVELDMAVPTYGHSRTTLRTGAKYTVRVKAEIWGHAFYEEQQIMGLKIVARKGMRELGIVTKKMAVGLKTRVRPQNPALFGLLCDGEREAVVKVNGHLLRGFNKNRRYVDISPYISVGNDNDIDIITNKRDGFYFIEAIKAKNFRLAPLTATDFIRWAASVENVRIKLPFELNNGADKLVLAPVPDFASRRGKSLRVDVEGQGIKVTGFLGEHCVGRLWLKNPTDNAPDIVYGENNALFIPSFLFGEGKNTIILYVEGVSEKRQCVLSNIEFTSIEE